MAGAPWVGVKVEQRVEANKVESREVACTAAAVKVVVEMEEVKVVARVAGKEVATEAVRAVGTAEAWKAPVAMGKVRGWYHLG